MVEKLRSVSFYVLGFFAVGYLAYLLAPIQGDVDGVRVTATLAVAFLFFALANVERVTSINLLGMKMTFAEARKVVDEANEALVQLRQVAVVLSDVLIENLASAGRFGGRGAEQSEAQKEQLLATLRELKVAANEVKKVSAADRVWVIIDYVNAICDKLPSDSKHNEAWAEWWSPYNRTVERPSPQEIEMKLGQFDMLTPERKEWLKDYKHYLRTGNHRRRDVWIKRDDRDLNTI